MTEHLPPPQLEVPNPPELSRPSYESLVRFATMFASVGDPLSLSGERVHYKTVEDSTFLDVRLKFSTKEADHKLFEIADAKALFVDPRSMVGGPEHGIGLLAERKIKPEALPFDIPFQEATVRVVTFNESVLPVANRRPKGVTDLTGLPLAALSINFNTNIDNPETGEAFYDEGQWMNILVLPPEDGTDVSRSLRIRGFGDYVYADGAQEMLRDTSSGYYQAVDALTGHAYPWLRRSRTYDYDFSNAATNRIITERHVAAGGDRWDLEFMENPYEGYIDGQLLDGIVGEDGAKMLQQLIEIAMRDGLPISRNPVL